MPEMTAEIFGKVTGLGRGKGGHMHLFDRRAQFSCSGIIGASLPPACGAALAAKLRGTRSVAVAFFGEGADQPGRVPRVAEPGGVVEAAGGLRRARTTSGRSRCRSPRPPRWPRTPTGPPAYGMPGVLVEHNDAVDVCDRRRRGGRARPPRRRPDADRGEDRPLSRPLPGRPRGLPAQGRSGGAAQARSDSRAWRQLRELQAARRRS